MAVTFSPEAYRIFHRLQPSTTRLEFVEPLAGTATPRWLLLAVPSMRLVAAWAADDGDHAALVAAEVQTLLLERREGITRPYGTCPRCAGPLKTSYITVGIDPTIYRWCPQCQLFTQPAGPRVGSVEDAAAKARRAANAARFPGKRMAR